MNDRRRFIKDTVATGLVLWSGDAAASVLGAPSQTGPLLFLVREDLPAINAKLKNAEYASMWNALLTRADNYLNPSSKDYADPSAYDKMGPGDFFVARQLATQLEALGFVYQVTGQLRYAQAGAALLDHVAQKVPVDAPTAVPPFLGAYGDMMRAASIGLDLVSDGMTPQQRTRIVSWAKKYGMRVIDEFKQRPDSRWSSPHNFSGVCGGAVGMLALSLRNDDPAQMAEWISLAEKMVIEWFGAGFDPQGSYFEGVMYVQYGLSNAMIFAHALRCIGRPSAILNHELLTKLSTYYAMMLLPGRAEFDARNDALYVMDLSGGAGLGSPYPLLLSAGLRGPGSEDLLAGYVWNHSGIRKQNFPLQIAWGPDAGTARLPERRPEQILSAPFGMHYKEQGLCIWRTGWDKKDTMMSVEAGPYHPVNHNQADKGHFNFYSMGYRWAIDCGYGNNHDVGGRCQTVAHSCVLVDGKGQALTGAALGTDGAVLRYDNNPNYGYALIDAKSAYNHNSKGMPGIPLTKALRHVFFVRPSSTNPAYAVVLDDISWEDHEHDFMWQLVTDADMDVSVGEDGSFDVKPSGVQDGPKMKVLLQASGPLKLTSDTYKPDSYAGRPPYVFKRLRGSLKTSNPGFVAVVAPLPPGVAEPKLSVETADGGRLITVHWSGASQRISWKSGEAKWL